MKDPKFETHTMSGRPRCRWVMKAVFYNKDEKGNNRMFFYRADLLMEKYALKNIHFATPLAALHYEYKLIKNQCKEIVTFDNTLPYHDRVTSITQDGVVTFPPAFVQKKAAQVQPAVYGKNIPTGEDIAAAISYAKQMFSNQNQQIA